MNAEEKLEQFMKWAPYWVEVAVFSLLLSIVSGLITLSVFSGLVTSLVAVMITEMTRFRVKKARNKSEKWNWLATLVPSLLLLVIYFAIRSIFG